MLNTIWTFLGNYAAEVIAGSAVVFSAYQVISTRRHNELSVRPHLTTFTNRHTASERCFFAVRLMNNGVGPAFIKSFTILLDSVPLAGDPDGVLKELLGERGFNHTVTTLEDDYAMRPGEVRDLLVVQISLAEDERVEDVEAKLARLDLLIMYACAYKKISTLDTRKRKRSANNVL